MSNLLKDIYSAEFYERLCDVMETSLEGFDRARFLARIFSPEFAAMELKQRMSHTIEAIAEFLPGDFEAGAQIKTRRKSFMMVVRFRRKPDYRALQLTLNSALRPADRRHEMEFPVPGQFGSLLLPQKCLRPVRCFRE